ncbi:hypothetical protein, partial [Falsiroseomonas oryziterrae]
RPGLSPDHARFVALATERLRAAMATGDVHTAVIRALIWVRLPTANADERAFAIIRRIRTAVGREKLPLAEFKRIVRHQFFMLLIDEARAIETLPAMLPDDPAVRAEALAVLRSIVEATGDLPPEVARRMGELERIFGSQPPALRDETLSAERYGLPPGATGAERAAAPRTGRSAWAAGSRGQKGRPQRPS